MFLFLDTLGKKENHKFGKFVKAAERNFEPIKIFSDTAVKKGPQKNSANIEE
jgi:hypothetical protein